MKEKTPAIVTFRTKVKTMIGTDDVRKNVIDYKLNVSRKDCNLKPHQHDYYNSDMFPSMLQHAYDAAIDKKRWTYLESLPETVKVDASGFLATVTVEVLV